MGKLKYIKETIIAMFTKRRQIMNRYYVVGEVTVKDKRSIEFVNMIRAEDPKTAVKMFSEILHDVVEKPAKLTITNIKKMK